MYIANNPISQEYDGLIIELRKLNTLIDRENGYFIQVFLGKDKIAFAAPPLQLNGTTLVEFKSLFAKLGYQVSYDATTKSINGMKNGQKITLKVGSKSAVVNGKTITLSQIPFIGNGITMVPLRFVAEASGLEVSWNAFNRNILIASKEEQILHTVAKNVEYSNQYHLEGYMNTYHEDYPKYDQLYDTASVLFTDYEFYTTLDSADIVSSTASEVTVRVVQTIRFAPNNDYKDYRTDGLITLKKDGGGMWAVIAEGTPNITPL